MEKRKNILFLVLILLLHLLHSGNACKSKSEEVSERRVRNEDNGLNAIRDEEEEAQHEAEDEDETADDSPHAEEDFELICDSYVRPNRSRRMPDIIIIGAKKGGTRALIEFLKLHPKLKSAGPEIHFFDRAVNFDKGLDWYVSKMPEVTRDQFAMEKTPGYFHHPEAPERIKRTAPDSKLLLIVRDPVKRLISDYNQFRSRNLDLGKTYPKLEELLLNARGDIDLAYPPLQRSIYHHHMTRWFQHFSKDQIHIVHGEKFITEPWNELHKVEGFLNIEPVITRNNFYFNSTKGFFCAQETRSTGIWECTKKKCLSKSKGRPKPPVNEDTLSKLRRFYKEHNKIFESLVGMQFGWPDGTPANATDP